MSVKELNRVPIAVPYEIAIVWYRWGIQSYWELPLLDDKFVLY